MWGLTRLGVRKTCRTIEGTSDRALAQGAIFPAVLLCSKNNLSPLRGRSEWVVGISGAPYILVWAGRKCIRVEEIPKSGRSFTSDGKMSPALGLHKTEAQARPFII